MQRSGRGARRVGASLGFYWTLPLPHVGFTELPKDVEAAAKASQTIRYQRERVRRHVEARGGALVHEAVWMELAPDRGSRHVEAELRKALDRCREAGAELLYVDFAERHGWRPHQQLKTCLDALAGDAVRHRPLDPDPIVIDGRRFDPVAHFRRWQKRMAERGTAAERRQEVRASILALAADRLPPAVPRADYASLAEALNRAGHPDDDRARVDAGQPPHVPQGSARAVGRTPPPMAHLPAQRAVVCSCFVPAMSIACRAWPIHVPRARHPRPGCKPIPSRPCWPPTMAP